jgi:hypothetical protein
MLWRESIKIADAAKMVDKVENTVDQFKKVYTV